MIAYDLQLFAKEGPGGEKTEEPTAKKLDDARKEGQVAKSKEVANTLMLLTAFLILKFGSKFLGDQFLLVFEIVYSKIPELVKMENGFVPVVGFYSLITQTMLRILILIAPFLIIGLLVSFLADYFQITWKVTAKPLQPKLSKINPINGFKRIFSVQSLVELLKSIAKILLIAYVAYTTIRDNFNLIYLLFNMPLWQGIIASGNIAINFGLKCSFIYTVIAVVDYIYQKRKFHNDQKMTKQEVKDEYKQAEGDPQVKGRIKQKMMEVSRRRMMQALPEADVVITNPTHFAVAIKYDKSVAEAPIVTAKGADYLAQKIKEAAKEHGVEIVENKPLARMLYYNVELDEEIPPELYNAVAEIIAYVYHLKGKV